MNLVKFLLIGAITSTILGEFAHFPFGSSGAIYLSDILLFLSFLFFVVWETIQKTKPKFPPAFKFLVIFWAIGFASLIWSLTQYPVGEVLKGSLYLWRFIIYSSSFVIIFNLKEVGLINEKTIIKILGLVGIVITFLGFLQLIFFPKFDNPLFPLTEWGFDPHQGRLTSTFLDPNFVGAFLVLTLGLIIFKLIQSVRKVLLLQAVALILAIVLTFSRSAYLMLGTFVILGGVFIWNKVSKKQKYTFLLLCFLSLVGLSLVFPRFLERVSGGISLDKSSAERVVSWRNGWEIFQNKPILGVGFNNYRFAQEQKNLFKTYSADGGHAGGGADSWVIFILATTGLLGLVVYIVFWIKVLKILLSQKTSLGLVLFLLLSSLLINGQFINSLFFPPIMLWYFVALGISVKAEK